MANISTKSTPLLLTFILLSLLFPLTSSHPVIGATYTNSGFASPDIPPTPDKLVAAIKRLKIPAVHLIEPDPDLMKAFTNAPNIPLILTIPNGYLNSIAANASSAYRWIQSHVVPYYPRANITIISAGSEIIDDWLGYTKYSYRALPAMRNLRLALHKHGLGNITVSTTFAFHIIPQPLPPSAAWLSYWDVSVPILEFLEETNAPFLINLFPFCLYRQIDIPFGFALFHSDPPFNYTDPATGIVYDNLFDIMVDALRSAMTAARVKGPRRRIPIIILQTGWPDYSNLPDDQSRTAQPMIAELYLQRFFEYVRSKNETRMKKAGVTEVYVYQMLDRSLTAEDNYGYITTWGILKPNLRMKYRISFSGSNKNYGEIEQSFLLLLALATNYLLVGMAFF